MINDKYKNREAIDLVDKKNKILPNRWSSLTGADLYVGRIINLYNRVIYYPYILAKADRKVKKMLDPFCYRRFCY